MFASAPVVVYLKMEYRRDYNQELHMPDPDIEAINRKYSFYLDVVKTIMVFCMCMLVGLLILCKCPSITCAIFANSPPRINNLLLIRPEQQV